MATQRGTKQRHVRIPDDLWEELRELAELEGSSASEVLVAGARSFVRGDLAASPSLVQGKVERVRWHPPAWWRDRGRV